MEERSKGGEKVKDMGKGKVKEGNGNDERNRGRKR